MKRREFIVATVMLATAMGQAVAQQPARWKRVALVHPATKPEDMRIGGDPNYAILFEEMKRLGYVEGVNLFVDRYSAEGHFDRFPEIAHEIVATRPDVIFALSNYIQRLRAGSCGVGKWPCWAPRLTDRENYQPSPKTLLNPERRRWINQSKLLVPQRHERCRARSRPAPGATLSLSWHLASLACGRQILVGCRDSQVVEPYTRCQQPTMRWEHAREPNQGSRQSPAVREMRRQDALFLHRAGQAGLRTPRV